MIILGIDPSLRGTGWGILETDGVRMCGIDCGVIQNAPKMKFSTCLLAIEEKLTGVIQQYQPEVMAIEALFYAQNIKTALTMGQARGIILWVGAKAGLEIYEYAPRQIKQGVVGVGKAAKNQVGFMVRALLGLKETPQPDAADALAVALTHAHASQGANLKKSL